MPKSSKDRTPRLFFSHSSEDKSLLTELVEAARIGLNLNKGDIRCTSLDGYGFASGDDVISRVRSNSSESNSLIAVITPSSLKSNWVLFELGARWGVNQHFACVLACGADFKNIPEPIRLRVARNCTREDLESLFLDIADELNVQFDIPSVRRHLAAAEKISKAKNQFYIEDKNKYNPFLNTIAPTACIAIQEPREDSIITSHFDFHIELVTPPIPSHSLWICHEVSGRFWPKERLLFTNQELRGVAIEGGSPPGGAFTFSIIELNEFANTQVEKWLAEGEQTGHFPSFGKLDGAVKLGSVRLILSKA